MKMEWEEMEEQIQVVLKPLDETMREFISEINGKNMDYKSCRLLEDAIKVERDVWLKVIKGIFEQIRINGLKLKKEETKK